MAIGDLSYLQADAATLLGVAAFTNLPANEQAQVTALINEAYRECFVRPDGKRPRWGEQYVPFILKAPVTFTFTATQYANTIASASGIALEAAYAGSVIKIGTDFYTLATVTNSTTGTLMEPWPGASGTVTATLYYSSYVLPVEDIDVSEEPEVIGRGRLSPMTGKGQEIRNRNWGSGDFIPERGQSPRFAGFTSMLEIGNPIFYYVDSASLVTGSGFGVRNRFNVYPVPDQAISIRLRGNFVPQPLSSGADIPVMPLNAITDILLPIARAKVVSVNRRFAGTNRAEIVAQGELASRKLDSLAAAQKRHPALLRVKIGF